MISGQAQIKHAYQREEIANRYIAERFEGDYLGKTVHERQVRVVRHAVESLRVKRLLEIACGPARLTVHVPSVQEACAVEQSPAMLNIARDRVRKYGKNDWRLIEGDAFDLPIADHWSDLVMCFRLIRHFGKDDRLRLLAEIRRVLVPGGFLLFDVVNAPANEWLHAKWGLEKTWIEDYWFTRPQLVKEMSEAGFTVERLFPVHPALGCQYYLWTYLARWFPSMAAAASRGLELATSRFPLEWVALCRCE